MRKFLLLPLFSLLLGCGLEDKVQPGVTEVGKDIPSQVSYNTLMRFTSEGRPKAVLHAGRIRTYDAQRLTLLDSNVHVDFFDQKGFHSSQMFSKSAKINDVNKNMTAYEHVHIVSDSGTIVDTDSLEWNNQAQTLHSEARVRIAEANGRVTTGIGFESDQNLSHYRILHPIITAPKDALGAGSATNSSNATNATQAPLPQSNFGTPSTPLFSPPTPAAPIQTDTKKEPAAPPKDMKHSFDSTGAH
jgi:LPS export ABC transporter protein LptC